MAVIILDKGNEKICSVKRLSDGAVFTVGDKVVFHSTEYFEDSVVIIKDFFDRDEFIDVRSENNVVCSLNNISHHKKPIFTTEDGKDIFEGDEYWCVHSYDFFLRDYIAETGIYNKNYKRFSTKEAAEEYIRNNKPMYTLKDIEKCVENWGLCKVEGEHIERFLDKRTL